LLRTLGSRRVIRLSRPEFFFALAEAWEFSLDKTAKLGQGPG